MGDQNASEVRRFNSEKVHWVAHVLTQEKVLSFAGLNLRISSDDQMRMQFFLYEIVARVVAIYLCVDCYRKIRDGLVERKIVIFNSDFLDWSRWISHRDAEPVSYWIQIAIQISLLASCLVVAIHGWFRP